MTTNPIALVTGGSRGLGRSTVEALARRGVPSILTYNSNRAAAEEVVARVQQAGARAVALQLCRLTCSSRVRCFANVPAGPHRGSRPGAPAR